MKNLHRSLYNGVSFSSAVTQVLLYLLDYYIFHCFKKNIGKSKRLYRTRFEKNNLSFFKIITKQSNEKDPRDDLGGVDVARKALILARECISLIDSVFRLS